MIKADGYGWFVHSFGPRPSLVDVVESEPRIITSAIAVRLGETVQTHPFSLHWATAKEISALKFSDLPSVSSVSLDGRLTSRESDVAFWISQGKTNLEIGLILGISGRTVEKHVEHILRKLEIENRATAAVVIANALTPRPTRPLRD